MNLNFCPNKNSKEFKLLVKSLGGEDKAYFVWMRNKGNHLEKAPNGADSKLFLQLLERYGDINKAISAKARVYSDKFIKEFGDWINPENADDYTKQWMSTRTDENGEPNMFELLMFKFGLKKHIGAPILDTFFESDFYKHDIDTIINLVELYGVDLSIEDAIKIYNAIAKYVSETGFIPSLSNSITDEYVELIRNAFGDSAISVEYFATNSASTSDVRPGEVLFDLPSDDVDSNIELYKLLQKHKELGLYREVLHIPDRKYFDKLQEFTYLMSLTDLVQGIYGLKEQVNKALDQIENESYSTKTKKTYTKPLISEKSIAPVDVLSSDSFLTKIQARRLRLKDKSVNILKRLRLVSKLGSSYYILKGTTSTGKYDTKSYDYYDDTIDQMYAKICEALLKEGIDPEEVLDGYNTKTRELYFKPIRKKQYLSPQMMYKELSLSGDLLAATPTVGQIQKQYDEIADKIKNLFSELYKKFDRMTDKSTTRRKTLTKIFLTIAELKKNQSDMSIEIALLTAAELLGVINQQTGAPLSGDNLYAWFINQENKTIPYENVTPQQLLDIYKYQIGFYRSVLATIPDGASSLLTPTTRLNRQDVLSLLDIIENFWKHAVEMVGEREIDNMIDSFTGLAIPLDLKDNMKIVYRDWLHKNWFHGDITSFTRLFTSYGQSANPIVKIAFHLTQYAETKTQEELLAVSTPLLKKFQAVNTLSSWTKPGWQRIFQEVNKDGIPTGKWVRDINYGQYEQDLNEFVLNLNDDFDTRYGYHYVYDDLGMPKNSVTGEYAEDEEWIGGVLPTYVEYLLAVYDWKCEHANMRYTFDYYKERLSRPYDEVNYPQGHGLSLKTLLQYLNIQDRINYYMGLCTGKDGNPHPELPKSKGGLTDKERMELDEAKEDLRRISSPFEADGTPKVDDEYLMAMEILTWLKYVSDIQKGYVYDHSGFVNALNDAEAESLSSGDPSIITNFYKYNSEVRIDPYFLESIFGISDNISSADTIIKQIWQKCLENLTQVRDNLYTRNIESFKNNKQFWINYKQIVQDVMDNKLYDRLVDPTEDLNNVAYYYLIPYVDPHGNMYDIFGNVATSTTPLQDIMTWFGYIINYYKDIAMQNNGIIDGVDDQYGNPIIFYGSDAEIYQLVKDTLFTYEATWWDKNGVMHTERRPLPVFTVLLPNNKRFITHVPTGRFAKPKSSIFINDQFDELSGISELPKRTYYDNSDAYNKVAKNRRVKELYDACIQCMQDMLRVMGFNNKTFNYKLPMLNADTSALLSRGNLSAVLKSSYTVLNDDSDMRNIDDAIKRADGTIDFDIPLRLLQDLKDMRTLSSDVVQSVILYAQMAYNYRNKKAILDTIQTIHDNLTPEVRNRTATDYDRFNNANMDPAIDDEDSLKQYEAMMDSTMYGIDTGKQSKAHKEASGKEIFARKFGSSVVRFEALMTLGLNLLSMFAGGFDSMSKMLRESLMNRYMSFVDLIKSFGYVIMLLPKVIANWGNPLANCKIVAMMQLNSVSKDYTKIFDNISHNRFIRTANRLLMGGFSMFDYFSNMIMLRAHYRNVRFYDGDVIPKGFYTAYEMRQAFKQAGKSWKEGSLAHSLCKTSLWSAYLYVDHRVVVKPEYELYVTDKVKTDIRTKSIQRSALYNGMAPDNDRAAYLKTVWGRVIFAMRNWYQMVLQRNLVGTDDTSVRNVVDSKVDRIKYGKSFIKAGKKIEALTEEQSAKRMGWNFETNTPQEEIWKAFLRSAIKILRIGKAVLTAKFGKAKDIKLSNVEKYAIRGILTQALIIQLLYYSFIPIMNSAQEIPMPSNKEDAELTIDNLINNIGDLPVLWFSNATIRSYESNVAELNVVEPKNFVKNPSALFGAFDKQMALFDMAQEGLGLSTHTLDETITSGTKYKYFTRGERYSWLSVGFMNSLMTSLTIQGVKYNTQWYMNMYGDSFRRDGYDFTIGNSGVSSRFDRPKIKRPKIDRPKIKRPKIKRPRR